MFNEQRDPTDAQSPSWLELRKFIEDENKRSREGYPFPNWQELSIFIAAENKNSRDHLKWVFSWTVGGLGILVAAFTFLFVPNGWKELKERVQQDTAAALRQAETDSSQAIKDRLNKEFETPQIRQTIEAVVRERLGPAVQVAEKKEIEAAVIRFRRELDGVGPRHLTGAQINSIRRGMLAQPDNFHQYMARHRFLWSVMNTVKLKPSCTRSTSNRHFLLRRDHKRAITSFILALVFGALNQPKFSLLAFRFVITQPPVYVRR